MSAIINRVLSVESNVKAGTDSYIDDIIVNENIVNAEHVKVILDKFGLKSKPIENLAGSRVLGLRLENKTSEKPLQWRRDKIVNFDSCYSVE